MSLVDHVALPKRSGPANLSISDRAAPRLSGRISADSSALSPDPAARLRSVTDHKVMLRTRSADMDAGLGRRVDGPYRPRTIVMWLGGRKVLEDHPPMADVRASRRRLGRTCPACRPAPGLARVPGEELPDGLGGAEDQVGDGAGVGDHGGVRRVDLDGAGVHP